MSAVETISDRSAGRSWRDIRQEVTSLAMSRKGRFRRRLDLHHDLPRRHLLAFGDIDS